MNRSVESPYAGAKVLKFCPRCGGGAFRPVNEQRFECGNCGFVFYLNACGTVVAAIRGGGKLLYTVRAKDPGRGTLDLPGGFIDFYETAEEALRREIREELNLELKSYRFVCSRPNLYEFRGMLYHTIDFFFLCEAADLGALRPNDEIMGCEWFAPGEIPVERIGFESIRQGTAYLREQIQTGALRI